MMQFDHSDYVVYVDESGDHGLKNIDKNFPVFVLAFCIFKKKAYVESIVPSLQAFKFRHFGHDQAILHETDIRKDRGEFSFLKSRTKKQAFLNELTDIIESSSFTLISTIIKNFPFGNAITTRLTLIMWPWAMDLRECFTV